jgi:hypothetical protein
MRNVLMHLVVAFVLLISAANAQDTIKRTVVKKPTVTKTSTTVVLPPGAKPAGVKGATGATGVPINPKTGRPYSHWGYGAYAQKPHNAAAARKADSLRRVNAAKYGVTAPPVKTPVTAPPVASPPPVQQPVAADSATTVSSTDKSLNGQYQYLLTKVYSYQKPLIGAFWKNIIDSMNVGRRNLVSAQAKIAEQERAMTALKADAASKEESVQQADEISFLGILLSKTTYNIIMWTLLIVCAAVAIVVIARSASLKREATYRTSLYTELEEEYKSFKAKANDKEKKLARELQTERNKVDELMGRG